jgi:3-methyl-2-oxobutanoate hydroxymethyltransferase
MNRGRVPRFVKQYAQLGDALLEAARSYAADVRGGAYPDEAHTYH